ncbi:helix-turn-helix domain-containing protein [Chromobacterium vaccinii]|uniref:helix-turn-helix domain-containing protein n=1 Tax=Chromobacterium vaccinii TaxID=1108595 RepID=UPI0022AC2E5D|nr:helix-turn-helix domain-containing protein [Chromobacterium vaccinii]
MLMVLASLQPAEGASLVSISEKTGLDKKTVSNLLVQLSEQGAVKIRKQGAVYHLEDIGPVFKMEGARMALKGALNAPIIGAFPIAKKGHVSMNQSNFSVQAVLSGATVHCRDTRFRPIIDGAASENSRYALTGKVVNDDGVMMMLWDSDGRAGVKSPSTFRDYPLNSFDLILSS